MTELQSETGVEVTFETARARLAEVGQEHVLRFYHELDPASQRALLEQVQSLDLGAVPSLINEYVKNKPQVHTPASVEPAPYYPADASRAGIGGGGSARSWNREACRDAGVNLLREGKVACFTVAGGQGSRLGYEGPKGCYPAGAVTGKPLFQMLAEQIVAATRKHGRAIPWYIMTSPLNHGPTVKFFEKHRFFGLSPTDVRFFPQGVMPSFDMQSGRILLSSKAEIATNPDGHGGAVRALHTSGSLTDMRRRGIEHVSYFQVDNPLVRCVDPVFLGLHLGAGGSTSSREMSSKMIPKAYPEEKLGVFCAVDGKVEVVEYSDLPEKLANERNADGSLRFIAGSIAVHIISVEFLERLNTSATLRLPFHRAEKKIPHVNIETGQSVAPASNNGVKLEKFIFDALRLCRESIVCETDRTEEFAPIKNASGVDSPESCSRIQTKRAARWIASRGVRLPVRPDGEPDCTLEISPLAALEPQDLDAALIPQPIVPGARIALEPRAR